MHDIGSVVSIQVFFSLIKLVRKCEAEWFGLACKGEVVGNNNDDDEDDGVFRFDYYIHLS